MNTRTAATLLRLARHTELARMALRHVPEALPVVQKCEALERSITHALIRRVKREGVSYPYKEAELDQAR